MKKFKLRCHQIMAILKYIYYYCYCKILKILNDDVWLISERGDEARDNAYAFYKFMIQNHPEENFKFVITKNSADYQRFTSKENVIIYGSKEHYILFITAGILISSQVMGYSPEFRIFNKLDKWRLVKIKGKRVFLGHGINKDECKGLHYGNIFVDLMIAGAEPEFQFMESTYGYKKDVIQYTGLPRYDYLESNPKKQILIMPTWRMNLFYCPNIEKFQESNYFKNWYGLLTQKKLEEVLKKEGYTLYFYPHYEIQPFIKAFDLQSDVIKICDFDHFDVQKLLIESKLLITDYSSVFFDFSYMNKPLIYFQFDYQEYRGNHFKEGFFSYERDGFGPVLQSEDKVIEEIEKNIKNDFEVERKYQENRKKFFTLSHGKNCERLYQCIKNMEGQN